MDALGIEGEPVVELLGVSLLAPHVQIGHKHANVEAARAATTYNMPYTNINNINIDDITLPPGV